MEGLTIEPNLNKYLDLHPLNNYWVTIRYTEIFFQWYILVKMLGRLNTINIFDSMYIVNYNCIYFHLRRQYICETYDPIYRPVQILATRHLPPIQSRMKLLRMYLFLLNNYHWRYYGNPILSLHVTILIGFRPHK